MKIPGFRILLGIAFVAGGGDAGTAAPPAHGYGVSSRFDLL